MVVGSAETHNSKQGGGGLFCFFIKGCCDVYANCQFATAIFCSNINGSIVICESVRFYNNKYSQPNSVLLCINSSITIFWFACVKKAFGQRYHFLEIDNYCQVLM